MLALAKGLRFFLVCIFLSVLTLNNSFITIFTPLDKTVYVEIVPVESMLHHNKTP